MGELSNFEAQHRGGFLVSLFLLHKYVARPRLCVVNTRVYGSGRRKHEGYEESQYLPHEFSLVEEQRAEVPRKAQAQELVKDPWLRRRCGEAGATSGVPTHRGGQGQGKDGIVLGRG